MTRPAIGNVTNGAIVTPGSYNVLDSTAGAVTWTAADVLSGLIQHDPGGAVTDVLPSFALLVAEMRARGLPTAPGTTFKCLFVNMANGAEVITITAGADGTIVPASVTPTQSESTELTFYLDSATTYTVFARTIGA